MKNLNYISFFSAVILSACFMSCDGETTETHEESEPEETVNEEETSPAGDQDSSDPDPGAGCDLYKGRNPVECNPFFIDTGRPVDNDIHNPRVRPFRNDS